MSANLFDVGDAQRLERERTLTVQAPRVPPVEPEVEEENPFDFVLDGILAVLKEGL